MVCMGPDIVGRSLRWLLSHPYCNRPSGIVCPIGTVSKLVQLIAVEMELSLITIALDERRANPFLVLPIKVEIEATVLCHPGCPSFEQPALSL